jgi:broad specificity phosphatase PhoE
LSTLYLIRHGQAGTRDNYDQLSEVGQQQAQRLGYYWATQQPPLDVVYAGSLQRQQQTAQIFSENVRILGGTTPSPLVDERWCEFSLAAVYQGLATKLCADEPAFAADYEEMKAILLREPHAIHSAVGRCDRAVIRAWMAQRYVDYAGESWDRFRTRVESSLPDLSRHNDQQIAVFTSATPIAIWMGMALGLPNEKILDLMGVLYNSGLTIFKLRRDGVRLLSFNTTPHLLEPAWHTFR